MATFDYYTGSSGTLGFPIDQFDGTPMPLDGLALRLVIYMPGADLIIPGRAESGEVASPAGVIVNHPSIAAFDLSPDNTPPGPRVYRCAVQYDDGTGWETLPEFNELLNVRNP